ncbi:MAG: TrbI/VirB10 family protein [Halarcobacter ebronensis]|uniref:TrbI/VirB10 family protein n=1 Tax=Halarcobacter ebronensis TaxID=1462615 RepID=UPI003C7579D1
MNKKKLILIVISFITIFIFLPVGILLFLEQKEIKDQDIIVRNKIPDGYFDPRLEKKEEVKKEIPKVSKPTNNNQPKVNNFDFVSNFDKEEKEVDYTKLLRNELLYQRLNSSNTFVVKKEQIEDNSSSKIIDDISKSNNKEDYDKDFGIEKDFASKKVKLNRVITADKMFSAILITAINSHLAGKVVAMIEYDIYGSHGKELLIPKGSTAIGSYLPIKKIGEERLAIGWTRIITPDGININLNKAYAADQMGRSGSIGDLDNRYLARYGLALSITTASNALSYLAMQGNDSATNLTNNTVNNETSLKNEVVRDYKNDIGRISDQVLKQQMQVKPVIKIAAGTRVYISPIYDIWFPQNSNTKEVNVQILKENEQ